MNNAVTKKENTNALQANFNAYELALVQGDLSKLSDKERLDYVTNLCKMLNVNPLTKPFEYIILNGKLTLYANKGLAEQLRSVKGISIYKLEAKQINDIYIVTAYARDLDGREDSASGAVSIANLNADNLANAIMKAETKAKRRVTLSICGLNMIDESELETIKEKKAFNPSQDLKVWGDDKAQIADKSSELKSLGQELRSFLSENGLSEAEQNDFIKKQGLFNLESLKKALSDKKRLMKSLVKDLVVEVE